MCLPSILFVIKNTHEMKINKKCQYFAIKHIQKYETFNLVLGASNWTTKVEYSSINVQMTSPYNVSKYTNWYVSIKNILKIKILIKLQKNTNWLQFKLWYKTNINNKPNKIANKLKNVR